MKKKNFLVGIIIIISFLVAPPVLADGWHSSDIYLHLYEPDQKAVISWNGQKETMILSSSVKSNDVANFVWVVPIQSSSKPEVSAGNISVFYDLVNYFKEAEAPSNFKQTTSGVAVLETKEIDVYDITILKATNADDLINWLNDNGYKVPEEARPIIEKYVNKSNFYFVANKIDLKNKHSEILNFLDTFGLGKVKAEDNPIGTDRISIAYAFANYNSDDVAERLTAYIISNASYRKPFDGRWEDLMFISKEEYEQLRVKYANIFSKEVLEHLQDMMFYVVEKAQFNRSSISIYCEYLGKHEKVYLYGDQNSQESEYIGTCEEIVRDFGSISNARDSLEDISWNEIKNNHELAKSEIKGIIDKRLEEISYSFLNPILKAFVKDIENLPRGTGTPLKFEFQPDQPYYPLEISSLNIGDSHIEVYILTKDPVKDKNDILNVSESKKISSELEEKLKEYIDIGNARYVTRLIYDGDLKFLTNDAVFDVTYVQIENGNAFERMWLALQNLFDWIKSLFS